jgi:hypothetical protein
MTFTQDQKPAFPKKNALMLAAGLLIIIFGFLLMLGSANTGETFNYDIFSFRRITLAPMVVLFGFVFIIFAILKTPKTEKE